MRSKLDQLDATVWRPEALARQHEQFFVQLADELRRSNDKIATLSNIPFEQIRIPRPTGLPTKLPLGIEEQQFSNADAMLLNPAAWSAALQQFVRAGWQLEQFEWHHEAFSPANDRTPAKAEWSFELHVKQAENRGIFRGALSVKWRDHTTPAELCVTNLSLLERVGASGFSNHTIIAPEAQHGRGQINVHPLIVHDLNGDDRYDIVLPGVNTVLLNDGTAQFTTHQLIEEGESLKSAGLLADVTEDGHLDLVCIPDTGPLADMLAVYAGNGDVPFRGTGRVGWEQQRSEFQQLRLISPSVITAADIDGDKDLDLFIGQYRAPYTGGNLPDPFYDANDGYPSRLLLNEGQGRFRLAAGQSDLDRKGRRRMLAASLVDMEDDGDMDLVTVNDFCGVDLFLNDGRGKFVDRTSALSNRHLFGMGHSFADFNDDGRVDLLAIGMDSAVVRRLEKMRLHPSGHEELTKMRRAMTHGNRLYLAGENRFQEPAWTEGLARAGWAWGTTVFDMDNDGDLDCYVANGHVSGRSSGDYDSFYWTRDIYLQQSAEVRKYLDSALSDLNEGKTSWNGYQHNRLFMNLGDDRYVDVAYLMGVAHESDCRAVVSADLNNDGRMDLLVTEAIWQGTPHRMRHRLLVHLNQAPSTNDLIDVRFATEDSGMSIGAAITLKSNQRIRTAQVVTGDSFQSQHPPAAHFALRPGEHPEELTVRWPDGQLDRLTHPARNKRHIFSRP